MKHCLPFMCLFAMGAAAWSLPAKGAEAVDIGTRRVLFVDDMLIEDMDNVRLTLHHPRPAETSLFFDRSYEGPLSGATTVIKDHDIYRLYYRGMIDNLEKEQVTCYAQSNDGIHWEKPDLDFYDIEGVTRNNIIFKHPFISHNFAPFLDDRAGVPDDARLKAVGGVGKSGLFALQSGDGIHWSLMQEAPVITKGELDSMNVVFWSESEGLYVCYLRTWKQRGGKNVRWISRSTSEDFLEWTDPRQMHYETKLPEQLYTNATIPYCRAPHIYIGVAMRFYPDKRILTAEQAQEMGILPKYIRGCSDAVLLTSRGGLAYQRLFRQAFLKPGLNPHEWAARANIFAVGMVPTGTHELSLYKQAHYASSSAHMLRYTLRKDGFVSVRAGYQEGEFLTKSFMMDGERLNINYATSAGGFIKVEILNDDLTVNEGYDQGHCEEITGDSTDHDVRWQNRTSVAALKGKPIRLRFVMKDADLYAFTFD